MDAELAGRLDRALLCNDEEAVVRCVRRLHAQGTSYGELLMSLAPRAAQTLELRFATPHAMYPLEHVIRCLPALSERGQAQVADAYVRYLAVKPRTLFAVEPGRAHGEPFFADLERGLVRSLAEKRVLDAFFYASKLADAGRADALCDCLRELASHEVDGLGHVFIFTTTALLLLARSKEARPYVTMALVEFLSRRALVEDWTELSEKRSLRDLLPLVFERINILGHNIIYANQLRGELDRFRPARRRHLLAQLARNIEASETPLTYDRYRKRVDRAPRASGDPIRRLKRAFADGDLDAGYRALADAWRDDTSREQLRETLLVLFARLDTHQPHFVAYPQATFELLEADSAKVATGYVGGLVEEDVAELGLAQLVTMGIGSAREDGLRPEARG
jgi:hypothetical protein